MYFNDVHILYYVVAAIAGLLVGQIVDWANKRLPEYKKVFSRDIITEYKMEFKPNYILMIFNKIYNNNTYVIISICYRLQIANYSKQIKSCNI